LPYVTSYPLNPDGEAQTQARPVVALLQRLHEGGVDRTENPTIAAYAGKRLDKARGEYLYEDHYARAVARGIVELAQGSGLQVVVKKENGMTLYGEDPANETLLSAASEKGTLRGAARWIATRWRSTVEATQPLSQKNQIFA
jgi:hypothetical protein